MKHERRHVMELKHRQFTQVADEHIIGAGGKMVAVGLPENHHAAEKVRDVRMNVQLNRIRRFKNVAARSTWYHELLLELIKRKIEHKPLVMYLNGK